MSIISTSFMNSKKSSVDGFIARRPDSQIGERHSLNSTQAASRRKQLVNEEDLQRDSIGKPRSGRTIGRLDIDASLREIDDSVGQEGGKKPTRRERRRLKKQNRTRGQRIRRRIIWIAVSVLLAILLAIGGYLVYKTLHATGSVLQGSIVDLVQNQPLKQDANGRSNFLVLGTTDDDPSHAGNNLTDTIMVISVDQNKKNAYTFSVPRDLYVDYGMACTSGYKGKINAYFSCVDDGTDDQAEQNRLNTTKEFIGKILGLDFQYALHVNSVVVRDAVDAVGGIDVNIEGSGGAPGILDRNFDWGCNFKCYKVKYDNGVHHLTGEQAMYLAMARGDIAPTYGLSRSNFDREQNQQKIVVALKEKAASTGTLTNLGAITGLIDAVGNNLRTDISTKEVRTLMNVANDIKTTDIHSLDFFTDENMLYTTGPMGSAGSVVYPKAGVGVYTDIQAFILKELTAEPYMKENASITVLNGTQVAGVGQTLSDSLTKKGFVVDTVDNAPEGKYSPIEIYQIATDKPATTTKLQELYNVKVKTTKPPVSVTGETDFVIIIGDASVVQ